VHREKHDAAQCNGAAARPREKRRKTVTLKEDRPLR